MSVESPCFHTASNISIMGVGGGGGAALPTEKL